MSLLGGLIPCLLGSVSSSNVSVKIWSISAGLYLMLVKSFVFKSPKNPTTGVTGVESFNGPTKTNVSCLMCFDVLNVTIQVPATFVMDKQSW